LERCEQNGGNLINRIAAALAGTFDLPLADTEDAEIAIVHVAG
jgi:hypothetical protein